MLIKNQLFATLVLIAIGSSAAFAVGERPGGSEHDPFIEKTFLDLLADGQRAFTSGDFDHAIAVTNIAIGMDVGPIQASIALTNRGNAYGAKGEVDKAMQDFDTALRLNPANAETYRSRGVGWGRKHDLDKAAQDFNAAINIDPRVWQCYLSRAELRWNLHDFPRALEDITRTLELNSQSGAAYALRGLIYLYQGENAKAISESNRAIHLDPILLRAYSCRGRAYAGLGRYTDANKDFEAIPNLKTKDPSSCQNEIAWLRATSAEEEVRNGQEAVNAAMKACAMSKWKKSGYVDTLAAALAENGDFDQAAKYETQALELLGPDEDQTKYRARLLLYQRRQPYRDELKR